MSDPHKPIFSVQADQSLDWFLNFDEDTGFLRRNVFQTALDQRLALAQTDGNRVLVFELLMAHMNNWVDAFGDPVRESMMTTLASRLRAVEHDGWLIGRAGSDGLLLCTPPFECDDDEEALIVTLQGVGCESLNMLSLHVPLNLHVGVAQHPQDGLRAKDLMDKARLAVTHCTAEGGFPQEGTQFSFYQPHMGEAAKRTARLLVDLPRALDGTQLHVWTSPEMSLKTGELLCMNCEPVWQHPDLGVVRSEELFELCRRSALTGPMAEASLRLALAQFVAWQPLLPDNCQLSVAMPTDWVRYPDLKSRLQMLLQQMQVSPRQIIFSLPERGLSAQDRSLLLQMQVLCAEGYRFALQGFGLGQASLTTLQALPVHKIKMAGELIESVASNPSDFNFVAAIVSMAKSLGLDVLAAGVHTTAQASVLARLGCTAAKGPLYLDHAPPDAIHAWLEGYAPTAKVLAHHAVGSPKKHLLLVDDEPNVLSALKRLLRRDGYEIYQAHSAKEAFGVLAEYPVDVILSDQRMPEMNGTEFLSQVKDLYPNTVRLVLSGYTEVGSVTEAINKGAIYKFLTKPWDDEQLRANIREAFQRHAMEQQNTRLKMEVEEINAELVQLNHVLEQRVLDRNERIQRDNDFRQVMQEILDNLPVGVLGVDLGGDLVIVNSQAAHQLGTPVGALIGRPVRQLPVVLAQAVESFLMEFEPQAQVLLIEHQGQRLRVSLSPMGLSSKSNGCLMTLEYEVVHHDLPV